jgi:hypothetical protein
MPGTCQLRLRGMKDVGAASKMGTAKVFRTQGWITDCEGLIDVSTHHGRRSFGFARCLRGFSG